VDDLSVNCVVVAALCGDARQRSVKWFKLTAFVGRKQIEHVAKPGAVEYALQLRFELPDLDRAGVFSICRIEQVIAMALLECGPFIAQYRFEQSELFDQLLDRLV